MSSLLRWLATTCLLAGCGASAPTSETPDSATDSGAAETFGGTIDGKRAPPFPTQWMILRGTTSRVLALVTGPVDCLTIAKGPAWAEALPVGTLVVRVQFAAMGGTLPVAEGPAAAVAFRAYSGTPVEQAARSGSISFAGIGDKVVTGTLALTFATSATPTGEDTMSGPFRADTCSVTW